MKRAASKKKNIFIWLIVVLCLLVVTAAILVPLCLRQDLREQPQGQDVAELYWNVDGRYWIEHTEVAGLSGRNPDDDGVYRVTFAVNSEQIRIPVVDKQLVNYIDTMDLMGLIFDADGVVVDVVEPQEVASELADEFYIKKITDTELVLNSSIAMNGIEKTIVLSSNCGIYDVSDKALTVGAVAEGELLDKVTVYSVDGEKATHVYVLDREDKAEVYWRVERCYDAATNATTREPHQNGVYTILFVKDGVQVELKCRDKEIVNNIDRAALSYGEFGLILDDEGYIVGTIDASVALRGKNLCKDYHVTAINGDTIELTRITSGDNQGKVITFEMNDICKIYNCCDGCAVSHVGEQVESLKLMDRVNVHTDLDGNPLLVFIYRRFADSPMYFNLQQKYNWDTLETSRLPDENGYYVYDMIVEGRQVTVRTKNKDMATRIDAQYDCCMGLLLDGSIIKQVYDPKCIAGEWSLGGTQMYVTSLSGSIITLSASTDFTKTYNGLLNADCKIYDVTGFYGVKKGSTTQLQLNDRVTCYRNPQGEVIYAYVTERYVPDTKLYYSINRKYDTAKEVTTREADQDGWYVFDMICEGKETTVKTKSKDLASYMDMQNAPIMALKVGNDGVVRNAYPAISAYKYAKKTAGYHYVDKIQKDGTYTTYYFQGTERFESTVTHKLANNCIIYNVSTCVDNYRGEMTTLNPYDQIQTIATNPNGESVVIFVMNRSIDAPLYWNEKQQYNALTKETTRKPNADGWYVFDLAVGGEVKQFMTKDVVIATAVDANYSAFTLKVDGNIILKVYPATNARNVYSAAASRYDVAAIDGKTLTLVNHQIGTTYESTYELKMAEGCKIYDISPTAENWGGEGTLSLGDRVVSYINERKEIIYSYIIYKNTRKAGAVSVCEHCGKEVYWEPYGGGVPSADAHYYLSGDMNATYQVSIGSEDKRLDVVLDLNGHTLTCLRRTFLVYGTLSVMDTAGGGKLLGKNITGGNGACMMVTDGGTLNLISGALSVTEDCVVPNMAGVLYIGAGATLNMSGGEIYGGTASVSGGNVAVLGGKLNMSGGKIAGDVMVGAGSTVEMSGAPVITAGKTTGLSLSNGVLIRLSQLTKDASVTVSANGVFTTTHEKISEFTERFVPVNEEQQIVVLDGALSCVTPGALALDAAGEAVCPACNEKVKWTGVSGSSWSSRIGDNKSGHYYLDGNVNLADYVNNFATASKNAKLCLHLNGCKLTYGSRIAIAYADSIINIMGSGTVTLVPFSGTTTDNKAALYVANSGTINLYGGTYNTVDETRPVARIDHADGAIRVFDGVVINGQTVVAGGSLTLRGTASVDQIGVARSGKLVLSADWTGTAVADFIAKPVDGVLPEANGACEGSFTGTLVTSDGRTITGENGRLLLAAGEEEPDEPPVQDTGYAGDLALDVDNYAYCPVCKQEVQWTAVSGSRYDSRIGDAKSGHYYLDGDVTLPAYVNNFATAAKNSTLCIHLNGNDLSYGSRIAVAYDNSTVNIMGTGTVTSVPYTGTFAGNDGALVVANEGTLNLYSGTYTTTDPTRPVLQVKNASATVNIHDGVEINAIQGVGSVNVDAGTLTLSGNCRIVGEDDALSGNITVREQGNLTVKADFTGIASVAFAGVTDTIPQENGVSEGDFTGLLYLDAPGTPQIIGSEGLLVITDNYSDPYSTVLELDDQSYGECPVCQQVVQWTPVTGSKWDSRIGDAKSGHYYLNGDVALPANVNNFATAAKNSTLCIHLNGNDLSYGSRIAVSYDNSTVNIMGAGTLTQIPYTGTLGGNNAAMVVSNAGTLNLYGGIYTTTDATRPVLLVNNSEAVVNVLGSARLLGMVNGVDTVRLNNGTLALDGKASADQIRVAETGRLYVKATWNGTAVVSFAAEIAESRIPAANGVSDGVYTGELRLNTADGPLIAGEDGGLVVKKPQDDGVLKILGIGNSFTWDSMHLLYNVYKAENPDKDVVLAYLYYGGCSLANHVSHLTSDATVYTYYKLDGDIYASGGKWKTTDGVTMNSGILDENWDIVTLQQNSGNSINAATYNGDIDTIRDYVSDKLGYTPEFAWNFTWGYPDDEELLNTSTSAGFAQSFFQNYGTTEAMYNKISAAVQEKIANNGFAYLMPVGTAIQNARSNHLAANALYRDYCHLNNLGRLIAAYTWYCELEGVTLTDIKLTKIPATLALSAGVTELDDELQAVVVESVNNALNNKFAVSKP